MGGETSHEGDFLVFEGNHYRNGFMYKNFVMSAIVSTLHDSISVLAYMYTVLNHFFLHVCSYMMESNQRFKSWRSLKPLPKRWSWKVSNLDDHCTCLFISEGCYYSHLIHVDYFFLI